MSHVEAFNIQDDPDAGAAIGQALFYRIALREQTKMQAKFLEQLGRSPFQQQFVLCGGVALHGVYLHERCSKNIDMYVPSTVAPRFYELASGCGIVLERRRGYNSFVLAARSSALRDLRIGLQVMVRPYKFQRQERRTFVAASKQEVPVNVLPFDELIAQKLLLIVQRRNAVDVLDLWLALNHTPELVESLKSLFRSNLGIMGTQLFSVDLLLSRLEGFREPWESTLRSVIYPVPEFQQVKQDLQIWLPPLRMMR